MIPILYWVFLIFAIVFGPPWPGTPWSGWPWGGNLIFILLFVLLGIAVFGLGGPVLR